METQASGTHETAPQEFKVGGYDLNTREDIERAFSDLRPIAEENGKIKEYQKFRDLVSAHSADYEVDTEKIRQLFEKINTKDGSEVEETENQDESNVVPLFQKGGSKVGRRAEPSFDSPNVVQGSGHKESVQESAVTEGPSELEQDPESDDAPESGAEKISKEETREKINKAKRRLVESTGGGVHKFFAIPEVDKVYKLEYSVSLANLTEYLRRFDDLTDEERNNLPEMVNEFEKAVDMVVDAYEKHHGVETAANDNAELSEKPEEVETVSENEEAEEAEKTEIKEIPEGIIKIGPNEKPSEVVDKIAAELFPDLAEEERKEIADRFFEGLNDEEKRSAIIYKGADNDNKELGERLAA